MHVCQQLVNKRQGNKQARKTKTPRDLYQYEYMGRRYIKAGENIKNW